MFSTKVSAEPRCPSCSYLLDGVTNVTGDTGPKPGDYSMCVRCGAVLRFGAGLQLRLSNFKSLPDELKAPFLKAHTFIRSRNYMQSDS